MADDDRRLDGNAAGGLLDEIFALEVTLARVTCAGCGRTDMLGPLPAYLDAPGAVVRCPACDTALVRVAAGGGRIWLDLRGARCLEFAAP